MTTTMAGYDDGFEALCEPFYHGKALTDPISTVEDKWQLLPAFLKVKGKVAPSCTERSLPLTQYRSDETVCLDGYSSSILVLSGS